MTEVIKTERLVLRRFRREDSSRLFTLLNDLDVVRWLTVVPHPYEAAHSTEFVDAMAAKHDAFAITREENLIGCISTGPQLGYWVAKASWGRGYVTEASRAMISRFFRSDRQELTSGYHVGNERSKAVLSKLGFKPNGQHRATARSTNEDVIIQDVLLRRVDWEAMQ
ncbi:GNAT family N-acetyltransferase [Ruegeria atlantica]|uniref:Putative ribosomal N-acetyltransferase YdaF n=1 Tax=Ruegeria atlantica TaxID=81569 RepID=A0A0P1EN78_9RHOB|nr:GNAT family N-acetyltransferase [Ruegeria atlantica]CUH41539.1 Putative ribosomal N-acetyltransferase YdaF [Ruegeria atlantica]